MSGDDINIAPDAVKASGQQLTGLAAGAKAQTAAYFTSQQAAAQGNPGFATGPQLVTYANTLHSQMDSLINDLAANGQKIVTAAQNVASADSDSADGFNREVAALNGLSKAPNPGR
jgi:hypothetical protein